MASIASSTAVEHVVVPSSSEVSRRMSRQGRRDTEPELVLRRRLHHLGLRFRVDHPLPGMPRRRADVLLTKTRIAVFVDGCFWHVCPDHASYPTSNAEWWQTKLARNVERDRETNQHLRRIGWCVLRFWEHDDMTAAADLIADLWCRIRKESRAVSEDGRRRDR